MCAVLRSGHMGAGAVGVEHLSLRPDAPSGHFNRKFDAATKTDLSEGNYELSVPDHFPGITQDALAP